jgi:hypothetical protein
MGTPRRINRGAALAALGILLLAGTAFALSEVKKDLLHHFAGGAVVDRYLQLRGDAGVTGNATIVGTLTTAGAGAFPVDSGIGRNLHVVGDAGIAHNLGVIGILTVTEGTTLGATGTQINDSFAIAPTVLDMDEVPTIACLDSVLSASVTGAAVGDVCILGLPAAPTANLAFSCFVSATDTVSIRACNPTAGGINPASASYSARVIDP